MAVILEDRHYLKVDTKEVFKIDYINEMTGYVSYHEVNTGQELQGKDYHVEYRIENGLWKLIPTKDELKYICKCGGCKND